MMRVRQTKGSINFSRVDSLMLNAVPKVLAKTKLDPREPSGRFV